MIVYLYQVDKQTERRMGGETGRQASKQTDRQTDRLKNIDSQKGKMKSNEAKIHPT